MPITIRHVPRTSWRGAAFNEDDRAVPEETAIALTFNGTSQAVMMATPADLEDFTYGFSLTERIVEDVDEIDKVEIVELDDGIEARAWIAEPRISRLLERRRFMAGPTGCGLCGVESLAEAVPPPPRVEDRATFTPGQIMDALTAVSEAQVLHRATRAVHGAGCWTPDQGLIAVREDLGRHNALDKLIGAMARTGRSAAGGIVVLTSRVSLEIVQKAAIAGAPLVVAISAPTALAIRIAEAAGITLIGVARDDGFEVFTGPGRIAM